MGAIKSCLGTFGEKNFSCIEKEKMFCAIITLQANTKLKNCLKEMIVLLSGSYYFWNFKSFKMIN